MSTIQRRDKNRLVRIMDDNHVWQEGQQNIMEVVVRHFSSVYSSDGVMGADECLDVIPRLVSVDMNQELDEGGL